MSETYEIPVDWFGVKEIPSNRGGSIDAWSLGESTRTFLGRPPVELGDVDESWILFHPDAPARRAPHPTRGGLFVANKSARQAKDTFHGLWLLSVSYNATPRAELPWLEPPIPSWNHQSTELIVDFDRDGKPVRNSAKQQFDPGVTETFYEPTLCISRNVLYYDASIATAYVGAVNSKTFYGAKPGFCRCVGIPAQFMIYQNEQGMRVPYWALQYQFAFRFKLPWQKRIIDAGFCELIDDKLVTARDAQFREYSSPVPLDGKGRKLALDAEPKMLDFNTLPEADFNQLGV